MKRILSILMIAFMAMALTSCNWFKKGNDANDVKEQPVVENYIQSDMEYMEANYGNTFVWFETQILLNDFLDEECDGSFEKVTDVFQVVTTTDSVTFDVNVIKFYHVGDSTTMEIINSFWIEDMSMNDEIISVTYAEAFELINEVNFPKPHSKHCVLRKEVGQFEANPQYIFGNFEEQLYVDALTGEVTDSSPSFSVEEVEDDTVNVNKPLGEWP